MHARKSYCNRKRQKIVSEVKFGIKWKGKRLFWYYDGIFPQNIMSFLASASPSFFMYICRKQTGSIDFILAHSKGKLFRIYSLFK